MANEPGSAEPFTQKLLFYTTAFFILLAIFSLFAFLFLVPFVIEPAFTTIFMQFNETAATCYTAEVLSGKGQTFCGNWTSCKEGCTKDVYECTMIRVNYKRAGEDIVVRKTRAIRDYNDYVDSADAYQPSSEEEATDVPTTTSEWFFEGARLMPNVKGCGYPPMLNCTIWTAAHVAEGANFSCYYSVVDPGLVITSLDMHQVHMNIVFAMAIPIPSFIVSVIYLALAYFFIYSNETTLEKPTSESGVVEDGGTPAVATSGGLTPASEVFREDMASFGHQLKVAMADDISRDSIITDTVPASSNSLNGSSNKMLMTSISTGRGPIADV